MLTGRGSGTLGAGIGTVGGMIHLEHLCTAHAGAILEGQDEALAREIIGDVWTAQTLGTFLRRCEEWTENGPVREYAVLSPGEDGPTVIGGGGIARLGAGLRRGEAAVTYWVLAEHRGRGYGRAIAQELLAAARQDPRITTMVLRIAPSNVASGRVARSLGARPTGATERHPGDSERTVERWELGVAAPASL